MSTETLTTERLREIGFTDETIKRLETWEDYEAVHYNEVEFFSASSNENKIYSGIDARRKIYFRDKEFPLFPSDCLELYEEYLSLKRENYLKLSQETAGPLFQRVNVLESFHTEEVALLKNSILKRDSEIVKPTLIANARTSKRMGSLEICLAWLNKMTAEEIAPVIEMSPVKGKYSEGIKNILFEDSEWDYYFETINDANTFVQCLNDYFEKGIIPIGIKIGTKRNTKTKLGKALTPVWNKFSDKKGTKSNDPGFYDTVRVLSDFAGKTDKEISKMM